MRNDALSLAALKYAAGELGPVDAAGFEMKLADDPDAREALEEAVRLSAAAIGQPNLLPDPLFRQATVESLRTDRSWVGRLFARRPYRGHPLTWTGAGAGAMAVVGSILWLTYPSSPCGECPPSPSVPNFAAVTAPVIPNPIPNVGATDPSMSATSSTAGCHTKGTDAIQPITNIPQSQSGNTIKPLGKG